MSHAVDAGYRRPIRQDVSDLRDNNVHGDDHLLLVDQTEDSGVYDSDAVDQDRSVIEEDDEEEEEDGSSTLSIPNESIDFDLVYSFHKFSATVEGQATVYKGDSLHLMDDSNSYWWLVRVLKTGQIGYIPAENIETPFERLARLNKHRNVDLASATPAEQQDDIRQTRDRIRNALVARTQATGQPIPPVNSKNVVFTGSSVYYYPPFVWGDPSQALEDDGEEFWDEDDYGSYESGEEGLEPDDGMSWEDEGADQGQLRGPNVGGPAPSGPSGVSPGPLSSQTMQPPVQRNPPTQSATAQQASLGLGPSPNLRSQTSRERLATQNSFASSTGSGGKDIIDPAQVTETRKLTATPSIAREDGSSNSSSSGAQLTGIQPSFSTSSIVSGSSSAESAGSKRNREEPSDSDMGDGKRSKAKVSDRKLRKDRGIGGESRDSHESLDVTQVATPEKKKKGSMFGNLFGKKKDKKDKDGKRPISTGDRDSLARSSAESVLINATDNMSGDASRNESAEGFAREPQSPQSVVPHAESPVSEHTIRMQQKDQEQQLRYQEYLKKSSSSPPDASSSFGLQSAASQQLDNSQSYASTGTNGGLAPGPRNTRPGSLILNTSAVDGAVVPDLSVLRVFAGDNLQSEATFKTVLINASTTSSDLVRQAMQRFRLPHGEDPSDYYLTVKQIGGDEATLRSDEHPLGAFEQLVQRAMSIPTVKRSSVGSISSLASNLSMHPAIAKLGMNDFTDDSTVKFYLHRALKINDASREEEPSARESLKDESEAEGAPSDAQQPRPLNRGLLTVSTSGEGFGAVSPERFSSPSSRFAVQIVIYPEDLPDGMVFDPHTEAIVPRSTLQHRSGSSTAISPGVSQTHRRKIFVFPKNTTVAEVIEASLERFGIVEGVVEGGDDVEDKLAKRRSSARVRYGLAASYPDGQQRDLQPSSKVLDAFVQPPLFKVVDRRSVEWRRRSGDSTQLLGSTEDVQPEDPSFVLRRAVGLRGTSGSRSKLANSLDEIALQHLHRDSTLSDISQVSSVSSMGGKGRLNPRPHQDGVSTRANAQQGFDIIVHERGTLRSARMGESSVRYSFVQPDGETYDISDIIEDEWTGVRGSSIDSDDRPQADNTATQGDLLEGALEKPTSLLKQDIDRVLTKLQDNSLLTVNPAPFKDEELSPSVYSEPGTSRAGSQNGSAAGTPSHSEFRDAGNAQAQSRSQSVTPTTTRLSPRDPSNPGSIASRATVTTSTRSPSPLPISQRPLSSSHHQRPSIASVLSDLSTYTTGSVADGVSKSNASEIAPPQEQGSHSPTTPSARPAWEDSGISRMIALIELGAVQTQPSPRPNILDQMFLGTPLSLDELHPRAREFFEPSIRRLDDVEKRLDRLLLSRAGTH